MDGITEENDSDVRFYSVEGERVACAYEAQDFLECPETRAILVEDESDRFAAAIEEPLVALLTQLYEAEQEELSTVLQNSRPGLFTGHIIGLIRASVIPDYDYAIFGREPDLTAALPAFIESRNKSS